MHWRAFWTPAALPWLISWNLLQFLYYLLLLLQRQSADRESKRKNTWMPEESSMTQHHCWVKDLCSRSLPTAWNASSGKSGIRRALVSLLTLWAPTPWPCAARQGTEIHQHPENTDCLGLTKSIVVFLQHTQKSLAHTSLFQLLPCLYWNCKIDNTLSHKGDKRRLRCWARARTNNFCHAVGSTTNF